MTAREEIGIQCGEISSTSDVFHCPYRTKRPFGGRTSYRTSFRRLILPNISNNRQRISLATVQRNSHYPTPNLVPVNNYALSTRGAMISVAFIFIASLTTLMLVYRTFPKVTEEERLHIKIPWNIEDAKQLGIVLNRYKSDHYYEVMAGVFITYIFLQTFAIPGSLFLSILSGFLFPFFVALSLVCTCSMLGASLCFLLSQLLGRRLVIHFFPERAQKWAVQVNKHRDNLFNYIVFLRVTPFLPNWFINLTAPVIGVPLFPFAFGTFIGVAPPSFIAIQGGQTLHDMTASDNTFNSRSFIWLAIFGVISLIPIFFRNKVREKIE